MSRMITAIFLMSILMHATAQGEEKLTELLEGIRENYANLPGLSLSYRREVITKTMALLGDQVKGDLATGKMFFKPPYFLKLLQETPKLETVVADEETLWWYIPDQKRVYKYSALEFGKELRLLSDIFRGLIKVEDRFQVTLLDPNELGEYHLELIPKTAWQNIDRVILTVTKEHNIRIVGIHYQLGSVTIFTLNNVKMKKNFEQDFFRFTVPEGVVLVEEKGLYNWQ